jgi:hypothetical protein
VRLLAVEGCAPLDKLLEPADYVAQVLPVIVGFSRLFDVAPTVMELIKNNNLLEKFTFVFHKILKMSLNQR